MEIGSKIRSLRLTHDMTLEDLANRTELTKGFLSQLERDLTSPSIATLVDILEALGTNLTEFFTETPQEKVVFTAADVFEKVDEEAGSRVEWLIPNAQKNLMEPILMTLNPGASTSREDPHVGEEFGYCLSGSLAVIHGGKRHRLKKGESFYFRSNMPHQIVNPGKTPATFIWVAHPPSF